MQQKFIIMVVVSANDFRVNQKKYLDLVKQDIQVFLKRGKDLFVISPVLEQQNIKYNPIWVERMKKAEEEVKTGKITTVKSKDIWDIVKTVNT